MLDLGIRDGAMQANVVLRRPRIEQDQLDWPPEKTNPARDDQPLAE